MISLSGLFLTKIVWFIVCTFSNPKRFSLCFNIKLEKYKKIFLSFYVKWLLLFRKIFTKINLVVKCVSSYCCWLCFPLVIDMWIGDEEKSRLHCGSPHDVSSRRLSQRLDDNADFGSIRLGGACWYAYLMLIVPSPIKPVEIDQEESQAIFKGEFVGASSVTKA